MACLFSSLTIIRTRIVIIFSKKPKPDSNSNPKFWLLINNELIYEIDHSTEFACGTPKPTFDFETSNFSDYKSLVVPDFNRFEDLSTDKAAQCYMYKYYDLGEKN